MGKCWSYFKYVMNHKKNVYLECKDNKVMFWHGVFHDLSKFSPKEFKAYANQFYGEKHCGKCVNYTECGKVAFKIPERYEPKKDCKDFKHEDFSKAWEHHYKNNKHHWNYWVGKDMPYKYIMQMVCDWKAMSREFGGSAQGFYLTNYHKMNMTWNTRIWTEYELCLNDSEAHGYGHTLEAFAKEYDKETYNYYFGFIKDSYGIDSYELLKPNNSPK